MVDGIRTQIVPRMSPSALDVLLGRDRNRWLRCRAAIGGELGRAYRRGPKATRRRHPPSPTPTRTEWRCVRRLHVARSMVTRRVTGYRNACLLNRGGRIRTDDLSAPSASAIGQEAQGPGGPDRPVLCRSRASRPAWGGWLDVMGQEVHEPAQELVLPCRGRQGDV